MSKAFARGACPGLSAPMSTGDGLLARLVVGRPDAPRCVRRALRRRAHARQRHHGDQRARQPASARAQRRLGAFVRRGGRSPRHRSLRERACALRSSARRSHRSDRVPGDRRGAASSHRRCRAGARAESLRGDRRRRAHRSRRGSRRYPAARHPDQRRSETPCRTRRRCLERDGSRRHRPARRGRCRAGFALDHRRHGDRGARRRSAAAA